MQIRKKKNRQFDERKGQNDVTNCLKKQRKKNIKQKTMECQQLCCTSPCWHPSMNLFYVILIEPQRVRGVCHLHCSTGSVRRSLEKTRGRK